jgi:hypothetical protein
VLGHRRLVVLVDAAEPAGRAPGVEGRALLERERIRRDVRGRERDRLIEIRRPVRRRAARDGEDEIEAHVLDAGGARGVEGGA